MWHVSHTWLNSFMGPQCNTELCSGKSHVILPSYLSAHTSMRVLGVREQSNHWNQVDPTFWGCGNINISFLGHFELINSGSWVPWYSYFYAGSDSAHQKVLIALFSRFLGVFLGGVAKIWGSSTPNHRNKEIGSESCWEKSNGHICTILALSGVCGSAQNSVKKIVVFGCLQLYLLRK